MSEYVAPLKDMQFVVKELIGLEEVAQLPGIEPVSADLADAIMEESAKFSTGVLSPLNRAGDQEGARFDNGAVTTPTGFKAAYRQFIEAGWSALTADAAYGGQALPELVATPVQEMWHSANMSFALCPLLTQGAVEALRLCGSDAVKKRYLVRMISGEWTGTMNLTEPQAGSDLSAIRTKAVRDGDHFRLYGQKIFITYGEHDYTENIVHLVLARIEGAPEGVKGISLFVVPKFLLDEQGAIGARNDVHCVSIEHKLGIHASPTAVLAFGDQGGAQGDLVGEENRGLEYMFVMMNRARFSVGLEGVGIAERAYQQAAQFAKERVQGVEAGVRGGGKVSIIHHPDVRRMLMLMKSQVEASRALTYYAASILDKAAHHPDAAEKARSQTLADLLIPIVKGWSTDLAVELASLGIQVHGGMGYIEETGAAQHLRDARITTIYEGTTGIQANDLLGRKVLRDRGAAIRLLIAQIERSAAAAKTLGDSDCALIADALDTGVQALSDAVGWLLENDKEHPQAAYAGAFPLLKLFGIVAAGWQMTRSATIAQRQLAVHEGDARFYRAKIATARFYADHVLSQAEGLKHAIMHGAAGTLALAEEQF